LKSIKLGAGAGYSGDRIDPAVVLAQQAKLDYLVFECLAERTMALAQQSLDAKRNEGYDPLLAERMTAVLSECHHREIRIISNMGAANPRAAARKTAEIARSLGLHGVRIAAITGDDVLPWIISHPADFILQDGRPINSVLERTISANAYLGALPVLEALNGGADVVLTGRVADPSLFVGPMMFEYGWSEDDWHKLGQATLIGHLLECAGQLTGGYFADPGYKDVPDLANLGFPYAEVAEDGSSIFRKVVGTGGMLNRATCMEQLLYEIQDPSSYFTPDVIADFTQVTIEEIGPDQVSVRGGRGRERPRSLKVSVGFRDGYVGEGQISYGGPGALSRAELAISVLEERLRQIGLEETRFDLIGLNSLHGKHLSRFAPEPYEVRVRAVGRASTLAGANYVVREVEALYTNGPAGGGGVATSARETITLASTSIPSDCITTAIDYEVS